MKIYVFVYESKSLVKQINVIKFNNAKLYIYTMIKSLNFK